MSDFFLFCAISIILCKTLCNARKIHVFKKRRQTDSPVSKIKRKSTSMMTLQPSYQEAYLVTRDKEAEKRSIY